MTQSSNQSAFQKIPATTSYGNENIKKGIKYQRLKNLPAATFKNRSRNIIWHDPHDSKNTKTTLCNLSRKYLGRNPKFAEIFNKINIKLS